MSQILFILAISVGNANHVADDLDKFRHEISTELTSIKAYILSSCTNMPLYASFVSSTVLHFNFLSSVLIFLKIR